MTVKETMSLFPLLDYTTAVKLVSWINKTIIPKGSDGEVEEQIAKTLELRRRTYNTKKGNLLAYLKKSIQLDVLNISYKRHLDRYSVVHDYESMEEEVEVDLSKYTDAEIVAMYKVYKGTASNEEIATVKGLINA